MTKKEFVEEIVEKGLAKTKVDATKIAECVIEIIRDGIVNNNPLAITGFGKFEVVDVQARVGRNPQTGEEVKIPARKKIKFVPSKELKESVN